MTYSSIGVIALLVQLIINYDVFRKDADNSMIPAYKPYRRFLLGIMLYYITDILWGILDHFRITPLLYADTVIYYIAMALSVLLWTHYVINYLNEKTLFCTALHFAGQAFFIAEIIAVVTNFFVPVMFRFDEQGAYQAEIVRYLQLVIQMLLFFAVAVHTLILSLKANGKKRLRYRTIGFFGIEMIALISVQTIFPLLPLYSIACMLGTCLLHTFVLEDEKAEYHNKIEELYKREQEQKHLAHTDPLTGVKSKHAYIEAIERIDRGVSDGTINEFGVIVFDLNGLKTINDTLGHEEGDRYIKSGCMLICKKFCHSPVYRIGGDEFAVILEGEDYRNRNELLSEFDSRIEENHLSGAVVVSTGIDSFSPGRDGCFLDVFKRADKKMYDRKQFLKSLSRG
jgi:diguanylate cyclase (GGDEF)-like protein